MPPPSTSTSSTSTSSSSSIQGILSGRLSLPPDQSATATMSIRASSRHSSALFPKKVMSDENSKYRRVQSASDLPMEPIAPLSPHLKSKMLKAVKDGEYSMVWALLGKGVDPNDCEEGSSGPGWAPLHWAAKEGNLAICQLLVSRGADVNIRDKSGQTPLHRAAYWGRFSIVDFLVYVGANTKMTDHTGQTAGEIAFHRGNQEVFEYLSHVKATASTKKSGSWNVKKQFEQLLKDQAKEDKLHKRNAKLEEKMSRLTKELSKFYMLGNELGKIQKSLTKNDQLKVAKLEEKIEKAKEEHRRNTIEISVSRSASFERYASENKAQTWMSFIEEL